MARRSSLPGADELFRATSTAAPRNEPQAPTAAPTPATDVVDGNPEPSLSLQTGSPAQRGTSSYSPVELEPVANREMAAVRSLSERAPQPSREASPRGRRGTAVRKVSKVRADDAEHRPSGRERHEEKITVYVSPQELLELERARWVLRAEHGLASDRGRIVREAVAIVLADLAAKGSQSILVTRLQEPELH